MRLVEVELHRVGRVGEARRKTLIDGQFLCYFLYEVGNHLLVLVAPRLGSLPMVVEVLLYLLHLLERRLLGVFLQTGVDGGVDLETAGIEVVAVVVAPFLEMLCHRLAEVCCLSVVWVVHLHVELQRNLRDGVVLRLREVAQSHHVVEHHIASFDAVLGVRNGVVCRRCLQHSHESGRLFYCHPLRGGVEVCLACGLYSKGICAEVHGVGVHRENLVLAVEELQFGGDNPLLALHYEHAYAWDVAQQSRAVLCAHAEHVLCQLLGDGGRSAGVSSEQHVLDDGEEADWVDAWMLVKTLVLGVD